MTWKKIKESLIRQESEILELAQRFGAIKKPIIKPKIESHE